jgi:hypothetical protein
MRKPKNFRDKSVGEVGAEAGLDLDFKDVTPFEN